MGLNADAELIWGVPVLAYDEETGEPTQWWDEPGGDWVSLPGGLEVVQYGHYEDPDNHRGILTHKDVKRYRGDCWEPTRVCADLSYNTDYKEVQRQALNAGLDVNFYKADWWLVSSYG